MRFMFGRDDNIAPAPDINAHVGQALQGFGAHGHWPPAGPRRRLRWRLRPYTVRTGPDSTHRAATVSSTAGRSMASSTSQTSSRKIHANGTRPTRMPALNLHSPTHH